MMEVLIGIFLIPVGYFAGSIPFGLLLTKHAGLGDVRAIGSGNIGATNVLRTGNKKVAALTLLLDAIKGAIPVVIAKYMAADWSVFLVAIAAVLGHIFPIWLKFKGGKGVATSIAVYWAVFLPLGIFASVVWIAIFFLSRISSFSSLTAVILSPVIALFLGGWQMFLMTLIIGGLVVYKHKDNILRLLRGQEKPFTL